jgi:long-chain acyl-CoA synthetase
MILNPKITKKYRAEIEQINQTLLGSAEQVKSFHLLSGEWSSENGLLTPSLKLRRRDIMEKYGTELEEMFKA